MAAGGARPGVGVPGARGSTARREAFARFSLLHLDDGEDYLADHASVLRPPPGASSLPAPFDRPGAALRGRLRLCSRSLAFEPDALDAPVLRFPFSDVRRVERARGAARAFELVADKTVAIRPRGEDAPYVVAKATPAAPTDHAAPRGGKNNTAAPLASSAPSTWRFELTEEDVSVVLDPARELVRLAADAPPPAAADARASDARGARRDRLAAFVDAFFARARREENQTAGGGGGLTAEGLPARLFGCSEYALFVSPATRLTPLVRERGRVVVTDRRACWLPDAAGASRAFDADAWAGELLAAARRRVTLRPVGAELFFDEKKRTKKTVAAGTRDGDRGGGERERERDRGGSGYFLPPPAPSALFAFPAEADREAFLGALALAAEGGPSASSGADAGAGSDRRARTPSSFATGSALLEGRDGWLAAVGSAWRRGLVGNSDYLLYLNVVAGRGCNDLAQWPVFPWVLRGYDDAVLDLADAAAYRDLARPVGALHARRLATLKARFAEMKSAGMAPYLYGTHYSAPGYVLYWLARLAPAHHLRLNGGRFDAPDRMFHGVAESWASALTSTADVKELVPEFFIAEEPGAIARGPEDGEDEGGGIPIPMPMPTPTPTPIPAARTRSFLGLDGRAFDAGTRQKDGATLGDVKLPPWARGSRTAFLRRHRDALESEVVSRRLHLWIDLVFGSKQTGPASIAADNAFHPLTTKAALEASEDAALSREDLETLEAQIDEFGQAPRRLFAAPHPPRAARVSEEAATVARASPEIVASFGGAGIGGGRAPDRIGAALGSAGDAGPLDDGAGEAEGGAGQKQSSAPRFPGGEVRAGEIDTPAARKARDLVEALLAVVDPPSTGGRVETDEEGTSEEEEEGSSRSRAEAEAEEGSRSRAEAATRHLSSFSIAPPSRASSAFSARASAIGPDDDDRLPPAFTLRRVWTARKHPRASGVAAVQFAPATPAGSVGAVVTLGRDAVVKAHAAFGFSGGGETVGASGVGAAAAGAALAIPNVERVTFEADEDEDEEDEEERDDRGVRVGDSLNGDSLNGDSLNGASLNGASTFSCVCFVGCGDGGVYAYDARRARVVARLDASGSAAVVAAVSPPLAPERLFTAAADGVAKLWDVAAETGGGREAAATSATFRRAAASFSRGSPGYRRRLRVARGGAFVATYGVAASAAAVVGGEALREAMGIPALGASGAFGAFGGVRFGPAVRAAAARDAGAPGHASSFRWTGDDAGAAFVADPVTTTPLLSTLACDPLGALAIVGGHSGEVAAWDPRYAREAWRAAAPRDVSASSPERGENKNARARASVSRRVSGVVFAPCLSKIITASEDGVARLLDLRRCGEPLDAMDFGAGALTCAVGVGARGVFVGCAGAARGGGGGGDGGGAPAAVAHWDPGEAAPRATRLRSRSVGRRVVAGVDAGEARGVFGGGGEGRARVVALAVKPGGGALVAGWSDGAVGVFAERDRDDGREDDAGADDNETESDPFY